MSEHIPLGDKIESEVNAFSRLWRNRRWVAILMAVGLACYLVGSAYMIVHGQHEQDSLSKRLEKSESLLREAERENRGLRETVAPLLARAAKEFPGEEINQSLKKVVEHFEADRPANKALASAMITVEVAIRSDEQLNNHFMDKGGYAALGKGAKALLIASAVDCFGATTAKNEVHFRGIFQTAGDDKMLGVPLRMLEESEYAQIEFYPMKENQSIIGGTLVIVLNGSMRLEFEVPAQISKDKKIFVPGIQSRLKSLLEQ